MGGWTDATRETAAQSITALGTWHSLHTGDPSTTGANEASGGSPAYARKQTTWTNGSTDGSVAGSTVTFDVPAGTYLWLGLWSASTGGTFIGAKQINGTTGVTLSAQGTLAINPTVSVPA